jgi:hypothetical protein
MAAAEIARNRIGPASVQSTFVRLVELVIMRCLLELKEADLGETIC